jgi:phospholipase/carboxylesterase
MRRINTRVKITTLEHRHVAGRTPSAPLLVVLHGRGDSMAGFEWLPHALGTGYAYLLLNAPDRFMPGLTGYAWYISGDDRERGILRSRDLLFRTLDEVEAQGVSPANVCLFGFSQGCLMAVDVALRYPKRLGAVLGFSGYVAFPEKSSQERSIEATNAPWRLSHGRDDDMLPIDVTREHVKWLQAAGIPVTWVEHDEGHTIPEGDLRDAIRWLARHLPPSN